MKSAFSINRVVAVLTPLVFTPAAIVASAWLAKHGIQGVDKEEILTAEIAGATAAIGAAGMWLHGHHKYEAQVAMTTRRALEVPVVLEDEPPPLASPALQPVQETAADIVARARRELDALAPAETTS